MGFGGLLWGIYHLLRGRVLLLLAKRSDIDLEGECGLISMNRRTEMKSSNSWSRWIARYQIISYVHSAQSTIAVHE